MVLRRGSESEDVEKSNLRRTGLAFLRHWSESGPVSYVSRFQDTATAIFWLILNNISNLGDET